MRPAIWRRSFGSHVRPWPTIASTHSGTIRRGCAIHTIGGAVHSTSGSLPTPRRKRAMLSSVSGLYAASAARGPGGARRLQPAQGCLPQMARRAATLRARRGRSATCLATRRSGAASLSNRTRSSGRSSHEVEVLRPCRTTGNRPRLRPPVVGLGVQLVAQLVEEGLQWWVLFIEHILLTPAGRSRLRFSEWSRRRAAPTVAEIERHTRTAGGLFQATCWQERRATRLQRFQGVVQPSFIILAPDGQSGAQAARSSSAATLRWQAVRSRHPHSSTTLPGRSSSFADDADDRNGCLQRNRPTGVVEVEIAQRRTCR